MSLGHVQKLVPCKRHSTLTKKTKQWENETFVFRVRLWLGVLYRFVYSRYSPVAKTMTAWGGLTKQALNNNKKMVSVETSEGETSSQTEDSQDQDTLCFF